MMPIRLDRSSADFDQRFAAFLAAKREVSADIESAVRAIKVLEGLAPAKPAVIESALHVDKTAIFKKLRKKILLIKLDHMGDFVLSIPAITKIRARYPYASIDVVVGSWNEEIAASLKIFDNIHTFDYFKKKSSDFPSMDSQDFANTRVLIENRDVLLVLARVVVPQARVRPSDKFRIAENHPRLVRSRNEPVPENPHGRRRRIHVMSRHLRLRRVPI